MPYDLHELRPCERDRAYVLVRLMKPGVDLARWRSFLGDVSAQCSAGLDRGITVAALGDECLVGLYTWSAQPSLEQGKIFAVDNFIAAGVFDPEPLFEAMMEKVNAQALEFGCAATQISLPNLYTHINQRRLLHDSFRAHGFVVTDQKYCRVCGTGAPMPRAQESAPGVKSPGALH